MESTRFPRWAALTRPIRFVPAVGSMAKYFVTSATGFIGGRVTRQLVHAGHEVVAIARTLPAARDLDAIGVHVRRGDITDPDSLRGPMARVDGVLHSAGRYNSGTKDRASGERIS